jgi:hypothetical protein
MHTVPLLRGVKATALAGFSGTPPSMSILLVALP